MECFMFVVLMSVAYCNSMLPERRIWMKERSTYWWEHVVKSTFTSQDWLENFRLSQHTFLYLCDELQFSIEKSNTVMRRAVPTDMHIAIIITMVPSNWCRLSHYWSPVWCLKVNYFYLVTKDVLRYHQVSAA